MYEPIEQPDGLPLRDMLKRTAVAGLIMASGLHVLIHAAEDSPAPVSENVEEEALKWQTPGFAQANTMGGGEAAIPEGGTFRVFVLMGQSNMTGAARARELQPPYTQAHDRIRIWANGRWEYFVPSVRFGPGVSMAHQLAEFWPDDTIGIIKVAVGGTGVRGFEKDWSFERAQRTFDGDKGSLYMDLMHAVAEARRISNPEFCGFVWKQGAADGTRRDLAEEYFDTFQQLISDLRSDLGAPDLPVFVPSYMNDEDLLKAVQSSMRDEDLLAAKESDGDRPLSDQDLLNALLSWMYDMDLPKARQLSGTRPYIATVIAAQNRAGRELPNVITLHPGELPRIGGGNNHYNAEGQITLGEFTASAVEEFYQTTARATSEALPAPTHADVDYGSHPRNVLDIWLAPSDNPTPLLVNIHGGGFRGGDKRNFSANLIEIMHEHGISVASINYRFKENGRGRFEGETPLYPAILHDGARALQFLRYHAARFHLDKTRFAATGGSAGGQMLMWLGFHPDLAQPDHEDPVLRESSRLQALAPRGGQTSVHFPTLLEWFGVESLNLSKQEGVVQSSSELRQPTENELALSLEASPITHWTRDDPPVYLLYGGPNNPVDETTVFGTWVHHPVFGNKLQEAMHDQGVECYLQYRNGPPVAEYESQYDFLIQTLKSLPEGPSQGN